jgi:hypothetical protein
VTVVPLAASLSVGPNVRPKQSRPEDPKKVRIQLIYENPQPLKLTNIKLKKGHIKISDYQ